MVSSFTKVSAPSFLMVTLSDENTLRASVDRFLSNVAA